MGLSNTYMVSRVESMDRTVALGATSITGQIYFLFVVIGMGTLAATAPMIATSKGANNKSECGEILRTGIELSFLISLALCIILFSISENFWIFHQPEEVAVVAKSYMRILTVSTIPLMLFLAVKQFCDGLGLTIPAMTITFVGVFANIFFNWIFIYGNLTFPAMGVEGSAIATLLARTIMALSLIVYVFKSKSIADYLPPLISTFNTWPVLVKIFKVGFPSGLQLFFEMGAYTGAGLLIGLLGPKELAANGIVLTWAALTYMMASGLSVSGSIRVGNAFGQNDRQGILRAGGTALGLVFLLMLFTCGAFIYYKEELVGVFSNDIEVIALGSTIMIIAGLFQMSDGTQAVALGILRGIEDVNVPTFITLIAYWVIGLPVGYILGLQFDLGIQGVWIGLLLGLSISSIWLNGRFYSIVLSGKFKSYTATKLEKVD